MVGWNEPVGDGLGDLLLGEVNEAWCRNAGDLPRGEGAVWEGLVAGRKVWVEDLRVVTRGRMGVKRLVGKGGSGGGSPLRVGVSAEELGGIRSGNGNGNGGRYRVSRFREVDVHGEMGGVERELRAEKGGDDDGGREEQREVSGRKRGLGKRMWKKVTGWNI